MMFLKFLCLAVAICCSYFVTAFTIQAIANKSHKATMSAWYLILASLGWAGYIML